MSKNPSINISENNKNLHPLQWVEAEQFNHWTAREVPPSVPSDLLQSQHLWSPFWIFQPLCQHLALSAPLLNRTYHFLTRSPISLFTVSVVYLGTSLVVQWLRLHTPDAGGLGSIPCRETISHMLQQRSSAAKQINNFFNKCILK